ncbi:prenyltransferase/squalene oxidase repeat-containing protein [Nonomuraea aurantiaca]|uniref:prenyltransferase/squalene oxidase repeat-containing protein n=1 Tax=Nonomuraea aurantiaca TaxID=2878562 RepID=UPI001CD9F499|nr:prenyltransferase/squalene oxidase repeat-containing protein [Nonomuraea aurantiaca]MCA2220282.1 terpene cyclase/mutase family protein [Nonomuraea aurantiaca]
MPSIDLPDPQGQVKKAEAWLRSVYRKTPTAVGWGHHRNEDPTEWGGTLDGIRGLIAVKENPNSPLLVDASTWLKGRQNSDGGFPAREMKYSPAEATAWVVIALHDMGWDSRNDVHVEKAIRYLEACVDVDGAAATTPRDITNPRTLPTALVLWALALQDDSQEQRRAKMVTRLRHMQEPESKGWGIGVGATPNAATTAQVLHALRIAGVPEDRDWIRDGVTYLLKHQNSDGSWQNSYDEWFTADLDRVPSRCVHYGTGWVLLALADFSDEPRCREAAKLAMHYLINQQSDSGAWLFEEYDPTEFVWCTTQIMVALTKWQDIRTSFLGHVQRVGLRNELVRSLRAFSNWTRESFLYLAFGALCIAEIWGYIAPGLRSVLMSFKLDSAGIWTNLASSVIWAALAIAVAWLGKWFHRGGGDRS